MNNHIKTRSVLTFVPTAWILLLFIYLLSASFAAPDDSSAFITDPKQMPFYWAVPSLILLMPIVIISIIICIYTFTKDYTNDRRSKIKIAMYSVSAILFGFISFFNGFGILDWMLD